MIHQCLRRAFLKLATLRKRACGGQTLGFLQLLPPSPIACHPLAAAGIPARGRLALRKYARDSDFRELHWL